MSSPQEQNSPGRATTPAQASPTPTATPSRPRTSKPAVIWTLAALLALLHQDFWLWNDRSLLLGFLPSGLAYHIAFSLAAAALWALALRYAWPHDWEAWAEESD